jgi:hypothetical protein
MQSANHHRNRVGHAEEGKEEQKEEKGAQNEEWGYSMGAFLFNLPSGNRETEYPE